MTGYYLILAALIIILCISLFKTFSYKKTVAHMITSIRKSKGSGFRTRVMISKNDETGMLASNINALLSGMEKAQQSLDTDETDATKNKEKMALIGEAAATVAHEIKNPLAGISGALQVLEEDFSDNSPYKEIVRDILTEIERLDMTVKDLIFYAKPPDPVMARTDIAVLLNSVRDSVKSQAQQQNVTISVKSDNIPKIMADPSQLEKALCNIAVHSLHGMADGGTLTITADIHERDSIVEIRCDDTGAGIETASLQEVFKPRFSKRYTGGGLGLAISRNIIEGHRGAITVDSSLGRGTTFRITLPVEG